MSGIPDAINHAIYYAAEGYMTPDDGKPVHDGLRPEFKWPEPA